MIALWDKTTNLNEYIFRKPLAAAVSFGLMRPLPTVWQSLLLA